MIAFSPDDAAQGRPRTSSPPKPTASNRHPVYRARARSATLGSEGRHNQAAADDTGPAMFVIDGELEQRWHQQRDSVALEEDAADILEVDAAFDFPSRRKHSKMTDVLPVSDDCLSEEREECLPSADASEDGTAVSELWALPSRARALDDGPTARNLITRGSATDTAVAAATVGTTAATAAISQDAASAAPASPTTSERDEVRRELGAYMAQIRSGADEGGEAIVTFPENFDAVVELMGRAELSSATAAAGGSETGGGVRGGAGSA
ncbi:unnamed protein product, partial [Phaeothamnion confervicola]